MNKEEVRRKKAEGLHFKLLTSAFYLFYYENFSE